MPQIETRQKTPAVNLNTNALLHWYDENARTLPWRVGPADRARGIAPDPYRVWLSEVMLQQTTVQAVGKFYARFLDLWPDVHALAAASLEDVRAAWAGLGYYSRARNLHLAAQKVAFERKGNFPANAADLQKLPGIGPYTAAAIAAICHDEPIAVLDGNVERVLARLICLARPVREAKPELRRFAQEVTPEQRAGDFAQAMMDLGATVCTPRRADCGRCPLKPDCFAAKSDDPTVWPVTAPKKPRPEKYAHAFVIIRPDGAVLLRKREEKGILAGMTSVPESDWRTAPFEARFPASGDWAKVGAVTHIFTHLRLEMTVWALQLRDWEAVAPAGEWHHRETLGARALPSLYKKVLATALSTLG